MTDSRRSALAIAAIAMLCAAPRSQATGPYAELATAVKLIGEGKAAEAEPVLAALTEVIPESPAMWYTLALARQMTGKRSAGIEAVKEAIARNETFVEAHVLAGRLYAQGLKDPKVLIQPDGDHKTAIAHLEKAVALSKDSPEVMRVALEIMIQLRGFEPALAILQKLRKATPDDTDLLWLQAKLALGTGKPKEAVEAYEALLKRDPKNPDVMEALGNAQLADGRAQAALDTYVKLLEINPSNNRVRLRRIALMERAGADPEKVRIQKLYVKYYARAVPPEAKEKKDASRKQRGTGRPSTPPRPDR